MNSFVFLILCLFSAELTNVSSTDFNRLWTEFKEKHNLNFEQHEDAERLEIFKKNVLFVRQHNAKNEAFTLSLNHFAYLKPEEIPRGFFKRGKRIHDSKNRGSPSHLVLGTQRSVDMRLKGYVPQIKNQKKCGSCYAFSSVDAIETNFASKGRKIPSLSQQAIVDCTSREGNHGCDGGVPDYVFEYAVQKGIPKESDYPYVGKETDCHADQFEPEVYVESFVDLPSGNEHALIQSLDRGYSVVIAIDASSYEFSFYKDGVFVLPSCSSENLNHAVLAVGYELDSAIPYLIVKNSWGENWGEDGYIKMALYKDNQCGIATQASYPIPKLN